MKSCIELSEQTVRKSKYVLDGFAVPIDGVC